MMTPTAPMAMPTISPVVSAEEELFAAAGVAVGVSVGVWELEDEDVEVDVEDVVEEGEALFVCSEGKPSPGLKATVAFLAYACCVSKVSVAF
jgi:hypothetical protein